MEHWWSVNRTAFQWWKNDFKSRLEMAVTLESDNHEKAECVLTFWPVLNLEPFFYEFFKSITPIRASAAMYKLQSQPQGLFVYPLVNWVRSKTETIDDDKYLSFEGDVALDDGEYTLKGRTSLPTCGSGCSMCSGFDLITFREYQNALIDEINKLRIVVDELPMLSSYDTFMYYMDDQDEMYHNADYCIPPTP